MAVQNSLAKQHPKSSTFSTYITSDGIKNKINSIVGGKDGQRFISAVISAVNSNPALAECDQHSIVSAALLGEALKLSPSPQLGQYYIVPFNDTKRQCKVAQFQLGYKGYIQLATCSGNYAKMNVVAIKVGELISYNPLDEEIKIDLIEDDFKRENTPTSGYYAMFKYNNGFVKTMYWSREKMEAHAQRYSKGYKAKKGYTFWEKDFDAMALKTMLRQLISKWGVMSIDFEKAYEQDMGVVYDDDKVVYVDSEEKAEPTQQVQPENIEDTQPQTNPFTE